MKRSGLCNASKVFGLVALFVMELFVVLMAAPALGV
jgi:hypothetical protein